MNNVIFHYSAQPLERILTLAQQEMSGLISISSQDKIDYEKRAHFFNYYYSYIHHISCFFDPLPTHLVVREFYKNPHYQRGTILYEHQIIVDENLELNAWQVVESSIKTFMLIGWIDKLLNKKSWANLLSSIENLKGYRGTGIEELLKTISYFSGKTEEYYKKAVNNPLFTDEHREQYAPFVPHLFLYPKNGQIIPHAINKIKL